MTSKPYMLSSRLLFMFIAFLCISFYSCKKDNQKNEDPTPSSTLQKISNASYSWGELSINKKVESDSVNHDAVTGNIKNVVTYDSDGNLLSNIAFTYSNNKITLNTQYADEYDLDNSGRVVYHSSSEIQQGHNIVSIERYAYDTNGYLNKVTMSLTFDGNVSPVFSTIDYEVSNGNYTKYTLSNTDSGTVTRQYVFSYNLNKKVNSSGSLFAPIFANDTYSNVDKYLNYGKSSVNLLTGMNYTLRNLDKTVVTGSFNVLSTLNSNGYIISLTLAGNDIPGFPSDNISPLPRSVTFGLK
jgi:hypothetical protein